jgi:hypothetical protein
MSRIHRDCPDCSTDRHHLDRRDFLKAGAAVAAAGALPGIWTPGARADDSASAGAPETLVKVLYESLNDQQRGAVCHDWDHIDPTRGLLRTRISNNWLINDHIIGSDFYTKDQQALIRQIFEGMYNPEWISKIDKQLDDDAGGYGNEQSLAIFGRPGEGKFELVMTGRHLTIRCDGNSTEHMAFGGPIFYGHAANGFNEESDHPGNVFWPQALAANEVFQMLDGKQREVALVATRPEESAVGFVGPDGQRPGIPVSELSPDQVGLVEQVLARLVEPYRQADRDEVAACLAAHGGLANCSLAFYKDGDIGNDGVWDCWRLEGPSFVWYFRGEPHVHVWVNVSDSPAVKTNA